MAEYVAGRGTTALGIVGTVLGSLGTAGTLGNGVNLFNRSTAPYEMSHACMHDIENTKELMEKDAEIARYRSEKYADNVGIELYKYIDGELKELRAAQNDKWTEQAVINATVNSGLATLNGQVASVTNTVAQITRTAVPQSAICSFGCGCNCNC